MALRKTHIVISELIITGGVYLWNPLPPIEIVGLLGGWLGSQMPDVDLKSTKINRWLGPVGKIFSLLKHRTWTHSIWAVILIFGIASFLPVSAIFNSNSTNLNYERLFFEMVTAGYFLHLLEDAFSSQGVCWLYPFTQFQEGQHGHMYKHRPKSLRFLTYRTGGLFEKVIYVVGWVLLVGMLFRIFQVNYLLVGGA